MDTEGGKFFPALSIRAGLYMPRESCAKNKSVPRDAFIIVLKQVAVILLCEVRFPSSVRSAELA